MDSRKTKKSHEPTDRSVMPMTDSILKDNSLRHWEYYGMTETFDAIHEKACRGENFKKLMKIIVARDNILLAYREIKRNSGGNTKGVDGITIKDIERLSENDFVQKVIKRFENYTPRKVRRVEIPKENGKKRPLGIPSMWDRIAQQCIKQVIEPICEAKFNKHSHGFRPNKSPETAMADATFRINRSHMQYVVDVDIKGFFDEVNHQKLMRQLWTMGIHDKQLLVIIRKMLKAPIQLQQGEIIYPKKGTPQGGILSPLLANIYLNELDWWITNQWEDRTLSELKLHIRKSGHIDKYNQYSKMRKSTNLKEMYIVRYADDFKVFTTDRNSAQRIFIGIELFLKERLKLPISIEKSRITNLRKEPSEFLGFELRMGLKGKKVIARTNISAKAKKNIQIKLKEQIKQIKKCEMNEALRTRAINRYNIMVIGIQNYYEIATEVSRDLSNIHRHLDRAAYIRLHTKREGKYCGHDKTILRFVKSKMLRYVGDIPFVPLGYVKHKSPRRHDSRVNKYTEQGRELIHKRQSSVEQWKVDWIRSHPIINNRNELATIEYNDNRISLFVAQKGRCAVTGNELILTEMNCHHKIPWQWTRDDSYRNLVLVEEGIHLLIHAKNEDVIQKGLHRYNLNANQIDKLNSLRKLVGNENINTNK